MQDPNHLSQPFTWQQFSHHHHHHHQSWTRHWNWLFLRQKTPPGASALCQAEQGTWTSNEQQPQSPPTEGKKQNSGQFLEECEGNVLVSCSALALLLWSGPSAGRLWCQCTCWGSQGCTHGNGAGDPQAVGTALHRLPPATLLGKSKSKREKKMKGGKKNKSSFPLKRDRKLELN